MPNSLTFDSIDLGQYGLVVKSRTDPLSLITDIIQLQDKAYANKSRAVPKVIVLTVAITATSAATLKENVDSVKAVLNERESARLDLDTVTDRYWTARFESLIGGYLRHVYSGALTFTAHDPFAFATSETTHEYDLDSDPKTVTPTVLGSSPVEPVYVLTAGEALADITLLVENLNTGVDMELTWEGSLEGEGVLRIDVANWVVTVNDVASMSGVSGEFPYLELGANSIKVTGFGSLGTLDIVYRRRFG